MYEGSMIGGYCVGELLGVGGAASVYRATPAASSGRDEDAATVALKILNPDVLGQPNVVASFQFENRVLSRLDHPGIVRIHDTGAEGDLVYAVLDIVDGVVLHEYLSQKRRLRQAEAIDLGMQLGAALDHLHNAGYVHRDVKPSNLILTPEGRLVLMDFGTAVRAGTTVDYEAGIYGTTAYLAPEQIRQESALDGRTDVYAMGIMLYRMVAGRRPFRGTIDDVRVSHLERVPEPPSKYARVSAEFDATVLRALAKAPDDRWQSAADFSAALGQAAQQGSPSRLGKLFGRKRSAAV